MKAIVVDKDYGSVTAEELRTVAAAYEAAGVAFESRHFETEEELIANCGDADVILGTGNPPITRRVVEALPNLKYVQRFGVGVNSIDLDACTEHGVIVFNIPGFCAKELADLSAAMILSLIRNTNYYDRKIREGGWPKCQYFLPGDVRTMTLGLFGFGAAGKHLYEIFHGGFGTKVIACDPYIPEAAKAEYPAVTFVDFDTMIKESDIVSIHVGLTPETKHVFNRAVFEKMKNTAMIINTARGPIINQKDLVWALENGQIRYAGLDTVEEEPIAGDDPLLKLDNVILNPHSGSYGEGAKKTQIEMASILVPEAVAKKKVRVRYVANKAVTEKRTELEAV
ncbi:MAG: C-terminal binding protein [Lachnospiraceae bacterium]|nr:C-terminal binding protein [Lachnospiraceae bacterium]